MRQQHDTAAGGKKSREAAAKKHTECAVPAGTPPKGGKKGFNFVCANLLFWCADSRFAKPRIFLTKVLIVAVRSCCFSGLIQGLENLETSCEGIRVVTFCVVQKVTKKHTGRSPATHDSNRRSIRFFCENDRQSSSNRFCEKLQLRRASPAMI